MIKVAYIAYLEFPRWLLSKTIVEREKKKQLIICRLFVFIPVSLCDRRFKREFDYCQVALKVPFGQFSLFGYKRYVHGHSISWFGDLNFIKISLKF